MCRMIGAVFRNEPLMSSLTDLREVAEKGRVPGQEEPGHRDGWGIVSFRNGSPLYIGRSVRAVFNDSSYNSALDDVAKLRGPNILIAHVRASSQGGVSLQNTHPFVMDGIVLAHNGKVKEFNPKTRHKPRGQTDSELLLACLADKMEEKVGLRSSFKALIQEDILTREYTGAILLVSDGQELCGYRDYWPGRSPEYYDLRISRSEDHVAFFQESLSGYIGEVSQVKKGELVAIDMSLNVHKEMIG